MTSHVHGATKPPLIEHTIGTALALAAERWGGSDALVSVGQGISWTFAELLERSDAFAAGLLALGLNPGDRIGIWAPNCVEWTLTQFAAARAGLILVTINPAYRLSEVEYTINKVGLSALVAASSFKTSDYPAMIEELASEVAASTPGALRAVRLPTLRSLILISERARP
ncbi:MAG TPA: AMP-binding protein, partial [Sphingopyxis sp.]|nr:AMP-binding protein [Sphingopyxis sp.]